MNFNDHENLTIVRASILDLRGAELVQYVKGCDAVASCLGHTLSFKDIYMPPRRLVTDAVRRVCHAIKEINSDKPTRIVLMNTAGNVNRDLQEFVSFGQRCVVGLVRLLLPPHLDNENAADFLRTGIGQHDRGIEWVVVRPDTLTDADVVTEYDEYPSPTRSAIFNPGSTSRNNVAHFMARLITEDGRWNTWSGQMPVIYNRAPS